MIGEGTFPDDPLVMKGEERLTLSKALNMLFERKEALLLAAMQYNEVASAFHQEAVSINLMSGRDRKCYSIPLTAFSGLWAERYPSLKPIGSFREIEIDPSLFAMDRLTVRHELLRIAAEHMPDNEALRDELNNFDWTKKDYAANYQQNPIIELLKKEKGR